MNTQKSRSRNPQPDWHLGSWKVRFGKQDEPGTTSCLLRAPGGAVLVEHGGRCVTRVRELTWSGRAPRRSEAMGTRLCRARPMGDRIAVLMEGALRFFDPASFAASEAYPVEPFADRLSVSPGAARCYAGGRDHTLVISGRLGPVNRLQGVSVPGFVTRQDTGAPEDDLELWVHPDERLVRLIRFARDDSAVVLGVSPLGGAMDAQEFLLSGSQAYVLGVEQAPGGFPFPGTPEARTLARWSPDVGEVPSPPGNLPQQWKMQAEKPRTRAIALLGTDSQNRLVSLEAPGKTHVQLRDPQTLTELASRAFPKNGWYDLCCQVSGDAVIALRKWEKVDHVFMLTWNQETLPRDLLIADARVTPDPGPVGKAQSPCADQPGD